MGNENGCSRTQRLAEFMGSSGHRAYHVALGLCRNPDEASDLVQETCYRTLRHWDRFDSSRNFESWFLTVLRHAFIDRRRNSDQRCRSLDVMLEAGDSNMSHERMLAGTEKPILEMLVHEETLGLVREAFRTLRPRHREVLTLCEIAGLQHDAIADKLGISPGTVRSRISRARQQLRSAYAHKGGE